LLSFITEQAGSSLLDAYGYDLRQPWACTRIEVPWAPGATILRFRKTTVQSDEHTAFTVLRLPGVDYVWVIPTAGGMLEVPHAENDPHNIAAFNALLRLYKEPVRGKKWLELGKLYMAILGHEQALPINEAGSNADSCAARDECSVSFSDRLVTATEAYNKWTLIFTTLSNGRSMALIDVSRETVRPGSPLNPSVGLSGSHEAGIATDKD
jgi:hypothetical protein